MIEFMSNEHRQRFIEAGWNLGYLPGESVPADWSACLYILTADKAMWTQTCGAIDFRAHMISWNKINRLVTGHGWKCMIQLANNLYNGSGKLNLSELIMCTDLKLFQITTRAIQVARVGMVALKLTA